MRVYAFRLVNAEAGGRRAGPRRPATSATASAMLAAGRAARVADGAGMGEAGGENGEAEGAARPAAAAVPPRPKRHRLIQQGRIVLGDSLVPCVIHDLSRAGAKIHLAARVELPGTFDLVIAGHDLRTVRASLRWRRGVFAGLAFLSPLP